MLIDRQRRHAERAWLVDFWVRRIRRLYPALLFLVAVLVAIVALMRAIDDPPRSAVAPSSLSSESWSVLGYYANWHLIAEQVGYFGHRHSLLKHTWSLAIEEQFYLVFPLLFSVIMASRALAPGRARRRPRRRGGVRGGQLRRASNVNLNTVYYSTPTNAYHLLIGVALAFGVHA